MPIVQFAPFQSLVQPAFWHALTDLKIDVLRLSDDAQPVSATYIPGRSVKDRETGQEVALGSNLSVGADAFDKEPQSVSPPSSPISFSSISSYSARVAGGSVTGTCIIVTGGSSTRCLPSSSCISFVRLKQI